MVRTGDRNHRWFALRVKARHEKTAAWALRSKDLEAFLPLYRTRRRWSDRVKELKAPLFPGYLFCRFDPGDRLPVLITPGVLSIVGFGKTPVPVTDAEVAAIQAVVESGLPAQPWRFLQVGQLVRIDTGPLAGVEGILLEFKSSHRLVVSVSLLQRSLAVEVDGEWISAVGPVMPRSAEAALVRSAASEIACLRRAAAPGVK